MEKVRKILISCQFASNKGDRAIAEYLISNLQNNTDATITLSTTSPGLWKNLESKDINIIGFGHKAFSKKIKNSILRRIFCKIESFFYNYVVYPNLLSKGANSFIIRFLSKNYIEYIKESDLVIITGGHHITSMRAKNALFDVTYDIALVSAFAKKYILWSQTIGPLKFDNKNAENLFHNILKNANNVYVRDNCSITCINNFFPNLTNIKKSYDSVFGFSSQNLPLYVTREKKVGISIFNGLPKAFKTFTKIAKLLDFYVERGYSIEFFRMEYNAKELNDINIIITKMHNKHAKIKIYPFQTSTIEHLNEIATCEIFIGYKTHSVLMALTTATPLIAIYYHKKTYEIMEDYGLEQYAIDDEAFDLNQVLDIASQLIQKKEEIHSLIKKRSMQISDKVKSDFSSVITV